MRIVEISYSLSSGGAERFVVDLCNELADNPNNEVYLITTDNDEIKKNTHYKKDLLPQVNYINVGAKSGLSLKSFIGVYKSIRKIKPDIVHAHCRLPLLWLPSLIYSTPKYIHTLHSLAPACLEFPWQKFIDKWFYKHKVVPITISNICNKSYKDLYKLSNSICITNGRRELTKTPLYDSVKKEIDKLRSTPEEPVFIHIARYAKAKNQALLFETFSRLKTENISFQLLVIGAGFETSEFMQYNDGKQIHILGEKRNIGDYMLCSDFFILSSSYEGLPLTLLEAMSVGCIPVCTPAGGIADVLKNGDNGFMASTFEYDDFYSTVKQAIKDKKNIDRNKIIAEYKSNYSMKICSDKYYLEFKNILNKQNK